MSQSALSRPAKVEHPFRRVAILFAGGPAPAANAVISTAAVSFLRNDIQVVGILHGYSRLVGISPATNRWSRGAITCSSTTSCCAEPAIRRES